MLYDVSLAQLRAWAEQMPPQTIVGIRGASGSCPVAGYLIEQGYENVCVSDDHIFLWQSPRYISAELDVFTLVSRIDKGVANGDNPEITAKQLLALIDEVEEERQTRQADKAA